MHEIPKSYGKFSGLAVSQKIRVRKLWSLVPQEARINILLTAQKNANEISIGATANKLCNTHSDECYMQQLRPKNARTFGKNVTCYCYARAIRP